LANSELERVSLVKELELTVKDKEPDDDDEQDGGDKA
jgi:hypothetical protein